MQKIRKVAAICLLLIMPVSASAVEDGQVVYVGGTVQAVKEGTVGRLDTTSRNSMTFESQSSKVVIPYEKIESYEYSQQLARHLGVLPAIAVGLIKRRQRRSYFRISYRDENDATQVVVFEVPKRMPYTLMAILQAQAPQGCRPSPTEKCTQQK